MSPGTCPLSRAWRAVPAWFGRAGLLRRERLDRRPKLIGEHDRQQFRRLGDRRRAAERMHRRVRCPRARGRSATCRVRRTSTTRRCWCVGTCIAWSLTARTRSRAAASCASCPPRRRPLPAPPALRPRRRHRAPRHFHAPGSTTPWSRSPGWQHRRLPQLLEVEAGRVGVGGRPVEAADHHADRLIGSDQLRPVDAVSLTAGFVELDEADLV